MKRTSRILCGLLSGNRVDVDVTRPVTHCWIVSSTISRQTQIGAIETEGDPKESAEDAPSQFHADAVRFQM